MGKWIGDALSSVIYGIGYFVNNLVYGLWRGCAAIVDLIELLFKKFAGLSTEEMSGQSGDISTMIIGNKVITNVFTNLVIFAAVMLIFFTIIQIIREQYKDKNGGNPYKVVFRMFKGMVLFMFITAACLVGLQLSGVVLKALDEATGNGENTYISGVIFSGMAASASRINTDPGGNTVLDLNQDRAAIVTYYTDEMWVWDTDDISLYWGKTPPDDNDQADTKHSYRVWDYKISLGGILYFNVTVDGAPVKNLNEPKGAQMWVINKEGNPIGMKDNTWGAGTFTGASEGLSDKDKFSYRFVHEKERNPVAGDPDNIRTALGKPKGEPLVSLGTMSDNYFFIEHEKSYGIPLRKFFDTHVAKSKEVYSAGDLDAFAMWVTDVMKNRGMYRDLRDFYYDNGKDKPEYLQVQRSTWKSGSRMSYSNFYAVNSFYYIGEFNWIIGFGGIFLALGVYLSFVFGLIQRLAELAILYVFSPVTLAFFPFDDGAMFNNAFVKPFYKKVISSYAPILSLNLFFPIINVFNEVTWFENKVGNYLTQCLVTIALLAMLPKMRTTIQSMLGADALEEKKIGQVMKDAWGATAGRTKAGKYVQKRGIETAQNWNKFRKSHGGKSFIPGVSEYRDWKAKREKKRNDGLAISKGQGYEKGEDGKWRKNLGDGNYRDASEAEVVKARNDQIQRDKKREKQEKRDFQRLNGGDEAAFDNALALAREAEKNGDKKKAHEHYKEAARIANGNTALKRKLGEAMGLKGSDLNDFAHNKNREIVPSNFTDKSTDKRKTLNDYESKLDRFQKDKDAAALNNFLADPKNLKGILANINGDPRLHDKYSRALGWVDKDGKTDPRLKLGANDLKNLREGGKLDADVLRGNRSNKEMLKSINDDPNLRKTYNDLIGKPGSSEHISAQDFNKAASKGKLSAGQDLMTDENGFKKYTSADVAAHEKRERDVEAIDKNIDRIGKAMLYKYSDGSQNSQEERAKFTDKSGKIDNAKLKDYLAGSESSPGQGYLNANKRARKELGLDIDDTGMQKMTTNRIKTWAQKSALADMIFNMDDGIFAKNKFFQTIDSFGFHKTYEEVKKIEANKTKRLENMAYAESVTQRAVTSVYENDIELARRQIQKTKAEELSREEGGLEGAYNRAQSTSQIKSAELMLTTLNQMHGGGEAVKAELLKGITGVDISKLTDMKYINGLDETVKKLVLGRLSDEKTFNIIFSGSEAEIKEQFKENADIVHVARERVKTTEQFKSTKETLSEFQEIKEICTDKNGNRIRTIEQYNKEQSAREALLDEYGLKNNRLLNIDDATRKKLAAAQEHLMDEDGDYKRVLKAYAAKQPTAVLKSGEVIEIGNKHWFAQFQANAYKPVEDVLGKINAKGVAFRDYAEKTGDRLDGLLGGKMASEQVKIMHDVVQRTSKEMHQLFRDSYFVDCLEGSRFQELSQELRKAYNGDDTKFNKSFLADITKKSELRDFAEMFSNMYGDADGEMRGGGFATAHNIIARTFRVAMVDRINEALSVTAQEYDNQQREFQVALGSVNGRLKGLMNTDKRLGEALKGFTLDGIDQSGVDLKYIEENALGMAKSIQAMIDQEKKNGKLSDAKEREYYELMNYITESSSKASRNAYFREEGDKVVYRIRRLKELDFIARNSIDRKGDLTQ